MPRPRPERPYLEQRNGKWGIVWWDGGGKRRRISTGAADKVRAGQALSDFEDKLDRGPDRPTIAEALDRYVAERTGKVEALDRLTDAAGALKAGMGSIRIDQINQKRWDRYAAARVTRPGRRQSPERHTPRPVASGTLRREFNVLRAALRLAWGDGKLDKPPKLKAPEDSTPRDRYLTKAEARKLLDACVSPHVRAFIALAVYTGARKGSILSLTWDRVNFQTGMIDFQEPGRRVTKKRRAIVPMTAALVEEMTATRKAAQTGWVVEYNGGPVPSGLRWSFGRLCIRAGLTWRPTPHHIKHSVASWFAMEKVPIDQAADWLATDPATLRKTYRKFDPAYLRSVASALDL